MTVSIAQVIEPSEPLRFTLAAAADRALADPLVAAGGEAVALTVLGPNAALTALVQPPGGAIVVLAREPHTTERMQHALRAGAHETVCWPVPPEELHVRLCAGLARARIARALEIERRALAALVDLSEALNTSDDIEQTLYQIARRMAEVIRSERCSIILLDEQAEFGFVVATSDDPTIRNHLIPVGAAYPEIREVVRTRAPLVIEDVRAAPLFDGVREIIRDKPVGHSALFPVCLEGRVEGVLHLRGAQVRTQGLSLRELRFGAIVANTTAIAVRNARLFQSIRDRAERVLSARVKAERRLKQLEKYQRFFDLAGDGIIIVDGRGRILFANREAHAILGFDAADLTQIRLQDLVEAREDPRLESLLEDFRTGRHRRRMDLSIVRASGDIAILSLSTAPLEPSEGGPFSTEPGQDVAAIISLRDVTVTHQMERELRKTKDFLENVIESSADAVVAADMLGSILIFNGGAERVTGYRREEVVGRMNASKLYLPGVARRIMDQLRAPEQGIGRFQSSRENLVTRTGELVPISLSAALLYDGGQELASVGIFSDLRERLRLAEELASAQRQLELTERQAAVVELAGALGHELSQPLTTILGTAELMVRRLPPEGPLRDSAVRILGECDRMAEIVRKIGQVTKYRTKPYLGMTSILDLDAASKSEDKR